MYIKAMKTFKCTNQDRWAISIPRFPKEKKAIINGIAKANRQSIGAYIGNLLDEEIRKAGKEERT